MKLKAASQENTSADDDTGLAHLLALRMGRQQCRPQMISTTAVVQRNLLCCERL